MKKYFFVSVVVISIVIFVGCKKARKPITISSNGDEVDTQEADEYIKNLKGCETPEELGNTIVYIINNYKTDGLKPLLDYVFFTSQQNYDRGEQMLDVFSNILDGLLKIMSVTNPEQDDSEIELISVTTDGDSGQIKTSLKDTFLIKKIGHLWFIDEYSEMFKEIHNEHFDKIIEVTKKMTKGKPDLEKYKQQSLGEWDEAKRIVNALNFVVFMYKDENKGDISGLDNPPGTLKNGFANNSKLCQDLSFRYEVFESLKYFDVEDFSLEFVTDGKDGKYIIKVDASKGKGGKNGKGPTEGTGSYNSKTHEWSGKLKKQ